MYKKEDLLFQMCCVEENRNKFSSFFPSYKITPRASFIKKVLNEYGIKVKVDKFQYNVNNILEIDETLRNFVEATNIKSFKKLYYYNIEVFFKSKNKNAETVVFMAHHDISNPHSENCQDNTASIVNLISLCKRLKNTILNNNVFVVFTDSEEFGLKGAKRLAEKITSLQFGKIKYVINSELTALGDKLWVEQKEGQTIIYDHLDKLNIPYVLKNCPCNDAFEMRKFGIKSLCFGILPDSEVHFEPPFEWSKCHVVGDLYEHHNKKDMNRYVDILMKMI